MIESWIRSKVGCGYVYGATGWVCSESRRKQQAKQYPEYSNNILGVCAKWDGKQCYDCAQLIRRALESVGIKGVPSGATSQYRNTSLWSEKGTIDTLPADGLVALARESPKGSGKMQHIGWRMSDGTVIDARGSSKGVIVSQPDSYNWTHWMRPILNNTTIEEELIMLYKAIVTVASDSTLNIRRSPENGAIIGRIPGHSEVEVLTEPKDGWCQVRHNDLVGYASTRYLLKLIDTVATEDADDDERNPVDQTVLVNADGQSVTLVGEWRVMADA